MPTFTWKPVRWLAVTTLSPAETNHVRPTRRASNATLPGTGGTEVTRQMIRLAVAILALVVVPVLAGPLGYRGLTVGDHVTPEQVQTALDLLRPCGQGVWGLVCNGRVNLSDTTADFNAVIGPDGTLQIMRFTFDSGSSAVVEATAQKQWGKPSKVNNSAVQNRFGAVFRQRQVTWLAARGVQATLTYRAGSLDTSYLVISTPAARERLERTPRTVPDKL